MKFYLGTHEPKDLERSDVEMFLSRSRLIRRKSLVNPICDWALDSGGFSQLRLHGGWTITSSEYVDDLERFSEMSGLMWAAPMDWMCEPFMVKKTGLTVVEHMMNTVDNFNEIRSLRPEVHVIPVLQGWELDDYIQCHKMYEESGVNLSQEPLVGIGSICRRQAGGEIEDIVRHFSDQGLSLHGFGVKIKGMKRYGPYLTSADSMAWSFRARYNREHCSKHKDEPTTAHCGNCITYAHEWRERVIG